MGVRLNKVLTELNISLQTAIDYLNGKPELGGIKENASVNTKISDEQYEALLKEFKIDKEIFEEAHTIFRPKVHYGENLNRKDIDKPQTFTPLGRIDLSKIGLPPKFSFDNDINKQNRSDAQEESPTGFDCIYRDKFINCYKGSCDAFKKGKWNEWMLNSRNTIEEFCRYYICWLCGEDRDKSKKILEGYCDFNNDIPKSKRKVPQGRRLITLIYMENGNQLSREIIDNNIYHAYVTLSEFIHNNSVPNRDNTKATQRVLNKLYDVYKWTGKNDYLKVKEQQSELEKSSIRFITSDNVNYNVNFRDIDIERGHEGDYMFVIESKHRYIMDKSFSECSEYCIRELLHNNDWLVLRQKKNKIIEFCYDPKVVKENMDKGLPLLKEYLNNSDVAIFDNMTEVENLYYKIMNLQYLFKAPPYTEDFINKYTFLHDTFNTMRITIDGKIWVVMTEEIKAEDNNFLLGNDARIHIKGLNHDLDYVDKWFDVKISNSKSEIIRKINSHVYNGFTLVSLSDGYRILFS
jgi:hypothetical protein